MERHIGLKNLGATCYINAILQCLRNLPPFRNAILGADVIGKPITAAVQQLFYEFFKDDSTPIDTRNFFQTILNIKASENDGAATFQFFDYRHQHDAHEYLFFLLDSLHKENKVIDLSAYEHPKFKNDIDEIAYTNMRKILDKTYNPAYLNAMETEIKNYKQKYKDNYRKLIKKQLYNYAYFLKFGRSFVTDIFNVISADRVKCNNCQEIRDYFSYSYYISIFMKGDFLGEEIDNYKFSDSDSEYSCKKCKSDNTSKYTYFAILPKIMIFLINRIKYDLQQNKRFKINKKCGFDFTFTTRNTKYDTKYDLLSMALHYGGEGCGHYTSVSMTRQGWIEFDDTNVREIPFIKDKFYNHGYLGFYITEEIKTRYD